MKEKIEFEYQFVKCCTLCEPHYCLCDGNGNKFTHQETRQVFLKKYAKDHPNEVRLVSNINIHFNGKYFHLSVAWRKALEFGTFKTRIEAAAARDRLESNNGGNSL